MTRTTNPEPKESRMPTNTITTDEPSVTIQTLRVGRRKLTATVFRQLKSKTIIDRATGELRGRPWGTVNLHTAQCAKTFRGREHLHLVWQDGSDLRRSEGVAPTHGRPTHDRASDLLTLLLADGWRPSTWAYASGYGCNVELGDGLPAIRCSLDAALPRSIAGREPLSDADAAKLAAKAAELNTTTDALMADVRAGVTAQQAAHRRAVENWHALAALPQLFLGG